MSQALSQLAESVGASERTLRRACLLGTIHAERLSPHRLKLSRTEHAYVARNWPVLGRLRAALRTEPNVSMAVLFGSVARGESDILSDVDLLIALRSEDLRSRVMLAERLRQRTRLDVELVPMEQALREPSLMVEILRDGRVLVDRDEQWSSLLASAEAIHARYEDDRREQAARAAAAAAAFARRAKTST